MADSDLFVPERWERIRGVLEVEGRVTVEELSSRFGVSRSTIRRDLFEMHKQNLVIRTRGGAVRLQPVAFDRSVKESGTLNVSIKERIGFAAAELISVGETVMIDAGSTTLQVVRNLKPKQVTLVTNSFDAATTSMAQNNSEVLMLGGMVRAHGGSTVGPLAEEQIQQFKADTALLGINAVSAEEGLTTPNMLVAQIKRAMIQQSRRLIIVADYSKLGLSALCKVAPLSSVEILVTDDSADPEVLQSIRDAGVEVIIAG
ncbi:MAG: DeoR/GlpR family DNA-binding transcription regulator [Armatimonadota bacterium]